MPFELVHTETIYKGRVFDVRQDHLRAPDGKLVKLDIVAHPGAVTLVPVDEQGHIWFIRQYRHPARRDLLELPAGVTEAGEDPEASARREIREEIGMAAGHLLKVGEFFLAPGYSTEYMLVYLATGIYPDPLQGDEDEYIDIEKIRIDQAFRMAETGQIQDAKSLAALFLARPHIQ